MARKDSRFEIVSSFTPSGSQPEAIAKLVAALKKNIRDQVLLGITGSGKTFTIANVVKEINRPTLVIAHNKTLAAQLFLEFKSLFPKNAVEYFVSFYDYYQPEAYIPRTDTYIEKDSSINDTIDKMRHSATRSLLERDDVLIVSSVSCIYGLGSPEAYYGMLLYVEENQSIDRETIIKKLVQIQYQRRHDDFHRGTFRVKGDLIDIFPVSEDQRAIRIEMFGDHVESLKEIDPITGATVQKLSRVSIYPTSHYITWPETIKKVIPEIEKELKKQLPRLRNQEKIVEAKRLEQRIKFDIEMLKEVGYCSGIENYSRHLTGREEGDAPYTLFDYFPKDYLLVIDESHVTVPQVQAMYRGDRARKTNLVDFGFRLPSALDNRPLTFDEFEKKRDRTIYVSATPAPREISLAGEYLVEQVIRPTGLLDPQIIIKPATNQLDHLLPELKKQVEKMDRTLITTLTKKSAEHLSKYLQELGFKVRYMHADVETLERSQLIRDLRSGVYDILVGINLLREGLDLPEVSLVAILDADKEGFLRSETALLQICGRAARNLDGRVIMFADEITKSMERCIQITEKRRDLQKKYNDKHGIVPKSTRTEGQKSLEDAAKEKGILSVELEAALDLDILGTDIEKLEKEKKEAVQALDFEKAALIRDRILQLKQTAVLDGVNELGRK